MLKELILLVGHLNLLLQLGFTCVYKRTYSFGFPRKYTFSLDVYVGKALQCFCFISVNVQHLEMVDCDI